MKQTKSKMTATAPTHSQFIFDVIIQGAYKHHLEKIRDFDMQPISTTSKNFGQKLVLIGPLVFYKVRKLCVGGYMVISIFGTFFK